MLNYARMHNALDNKTSKSDNLTTLHRRPIKLKDPERPYNYIDSFYQGVSLDRNWNCRGALHIQKINSSSRNQMQSLVIRINNQSSICFHLRKLTKRIWLCIAVSNQDLRKCLQDNKLNWKHPRPKFRREISMVWSLHTKKMHSTW